MADKKEKRYIIDNPKLVAEWNYEKNGELQPEQFAANSHRKVWWKCDKGHEWQATIANRNNGNACPYCASQKVLKGYNDIQTVNPILAKEWNYEKNGDLKPEHFMINSHNKVWWKCSKGHEWQVTIANRTNGCGCPYCSGRKVLKNYNDLQTVNPALAKEWNYEKNGDLKTEQFTANSNKKVWWKCDKGHEWQASINNRNKNRGCPYCVNKKTLKGYNDLQTGNPKLAIEWNHEQNGDLKPEHFTAGSSKKVWWKCDKGHEWQATIAHRNYGCGCPICMSERHTSFPEYALVFYLKKYGLEVIHSYKQKGYELDVYIPSKNIAIEYDGSFWHKNKIRKDLDKNLKCKKDGIQLYRIREGLPSLNDSSIDYIVNKNTNNLSIVLKKLLSEITELNIDVDLDRDAIAIENLREFTEKENSLLSSNPKLVREWNYEKNGNLKPEHLLSNSGKKVWWKCFKGHEWQASISHRNHGRGCPICANKKILKGYNDLQTVNPTLAKEWNYEKNGNLKPEQFMANSDKKVWWKCSKGHEWQAIIANRTNGCGCPYCSGHKVLKNYNDLQTINPTLAKEWNYEKNDNLKPEQFTANSNKKIWWKCKNGHEWQAAIANRNKNRGCPYCANKKILNGYNDLQTVNPTLAKEWNYEKNGDLKPEDFLPNSNKKVWWKCNKGHEWKTTLNDRNSGYGCPYCSGRYAIKGYNDLRTVNLTLAKEWNYEKNGDLKPEDFLPNSGKKVWWKCSKGHEWIAIIGDRNHGNGCPYCSGKYAIKGENDLQTINPTLANEWNYEMNNGLTPADVMPNSNKKVWWKCCKGHEWQDTINHRNHGRGCSQCAKEKRKVQK